MKVLIIIPCYNEEKNILKTITYLKKYNYDYVVINDGSTDHSLDVLKNNNINFINLSNNLGIGGAVQTGYKYALEKEYDIAVQFDGDGQHDASYITKLIEPIEKGDANLTIGSRFISDENESNFKSTALRRLGIKILSKLYKKISNKEIKDMTSGFRASDKNIIKIFAKEYPYEYPEPITNLAVSNMKIMEIPVKMNEREYGKSSITALKSIYYMINVIFYFFIIMISKGDDYCA